LPTLPLAHPPHRVPLATVPPGAPVRPGRTGRGLGAGSVPLVLLSLGGLCLLVAAVVFVAVTWSLLGQTGRTLVLGAVTLVVAACAEAVTRRGLRVAAETLWVVVAGLLVLDLLGARWAGLGGLDALGPRGMTTLVGTAVGVLCLGTSLRARRSPVRALVVVQAVALLGVSLVLLAQVWSRTSWPVAAAVAVPAVALLAVGCRGRLRVAAAGLAGLSFLTWVVLVGAGVERLTETVPVAEWWGQGRGWPLLVAGAMAAVLVHAPLPRSSVGTADRWADGRSVAAGAALLVWAALLTGPLDAGGPTRVALVAAAVTAALGLVTAGAPRVWARGAVPLAVAAAAGLGLWLASAPWDRLDHLLSDDAGRTTSGVAGPALPVVALAVLVALAGCTRLLPELHRGGARRAVGLGAPALVGLATLAALLGSGMSASLVVALGVLVVLVTGGASWVWREQHRAGLVGLPGLAGPVGLAGLPGLVGALSTAYVAAVVLAVAAPHPVLLAATATLLALLLAAGTGRELRTTAAGLCAALAAGTTALGGLAVAGWLDVLDVGPDVAPVLLAAYAGLAALLAAPLLRHVAPRVAVEVTSALVAVVALATAAALPDLTALAAVLTVAGSGVCLVAVTTRDRPYLGWVGTVVLAAATGVRVLEDVRAPELYTLPAALVLVGAGLWRLRRDPAAGSLDVLGSGVGLALLPSLLLALDEPVSLRGALVAAAGLLALTLGVQRRLAAPFVLGALTVGLLALRHLEPYAEAVPRWVALGGVGTVLLAVGITWESRRRDLDRAGRYLVGLR
ncbi:MAG: hypothetical protein JWR20_315, partial [Marmoricola sp.]|nr:hypothetical protein [Marmoricola sp.]